ncbi:MAG: hypothetical protein CL930_09935 [Deltaproteobacteria bacterium]|nr:hypothetical protein [Deltaproteobacteria bacterium]
MQSLVDQFCPNVHDAPISGAAHDPESGTIATADEQGVVAIQRTGEATPRLLFQPGVTVNGALAVIRGGSLVAVGDEEGSIGVYSTQDGEPIFQEKREGARGRIRAMRGVALNSEGSRLACIAADGLLRLWDLTQNERQAWRGFSGTTVEFDLRGQRLLAMDESGQPRMMDLSTLEALYMDKLQTPADKARFTKCGTMVVASGAAGISLLRVADGALIASFATQGGSGIQNLLLSPDGTRACAITQRSVHVFSLPELEAIDSFRHGAPNTTGAGVWHAGGIRVGGSDGLLHGGGSGSLGPVDVVGGIGPHRVLIHDNVATVWNGNDRTALFQLPHKARLARIDREGRHLISAPAHGPVQIVDCKTGAPIFDGGPETSGARSIAIGGEVVAVHLAKKGIRWWHLGQNRGYELPWPQYMTLSGSGTWLGVITPKGAVKILDPKTGQDAIAPPQPMADVPVRLMAFINRSPELLVLDEEGVLGHYDLSDSVQGGREAVGRDVLSINVPVDRIWGITGGELAVLRLPEDEKCTLLWVDIHACEVVNEITDLPSDAEIDVENNRIILPARAGAMVELNRKGTELRVLRNLADGEWISFAANGILSASTGAGSTL